VRLFSFGGYGLALAALALVVFGAIDSPPKWFLLDSTSKIEAPLIFFALFFKMV